MVTRLFDDSDPFTTIVEPGQERDTYHDAKASMEPPGDARRGWTNGISPDTSEDEGDSESVPRIVIKDGRGGSRSRGRGGPGKASLAGADGEPPSPSRMSVPRDKLPPPISVPRDKLSPPISTTSPKQEQEQEHEQEQDKRSGRAEERGRDRGRDRSRL